MSDEKKSNESQKDDLAESLNKNDGWSPRDANIVASEFEKYMEEDD